MRAGGVRASVAMGVGTVQRWAPTETTYLTTNLRYYTDRGPLSQYVSHDAADALVLAAVSVWNVKGASLTIAQGGTLDEDVSSANVYLGTAGPIWPADVHATNASAKPLAVVYDADGAITDMLRGSGASAPSNCAQAATTDSLDATVWPGFFSHAVLVINGRCTGPKAEAQLQLQYQLMRSFGRLLGVGWSQLNDNVFTGSPSPTYSQQSYWPIMHPIDIVCGAYTYQCLPNAFTLRPDDVAALQLVYPNAPTNPLAPGKEYSNQQGVWFDGNITFPNGMGMPGVNVVVRRYYGAAGVAEDFDIASGVSGYLMPWDYGNPVTGTPAGVTGSATAASAGKFAIAGVPEDSKYPWMTYTLTTQSINPLYVGQYAIMPYRVAAVAMSGPAAVKTFGVVVPKTYQILTMPVTSTAGDCTAGSDGTETQPALMPMSGTWTGRLCAARSSWFTMQAVKGRTATIEVTALDEAMLATSSKAMPLMGMWKAGDAPGVLPTMGAASAFNGKLNGLTTLTVGFAATQQVRVAIADARGEARPDFNYAVRVLAASSVSPARVAATGGRVLIHGSGFQAGNVVTVGGLLAAVQSLTANEIVAIAPALTATQAAPYAADVVVTDLKTGGVAKISAGLTYGGATTDTLQTISAPSGSVAVGSVAATMFAVRLVDANGTAVPGAAVTFAASAGAGKFDCGASPCAVMTDASGVARTSVLPIAAGLIGLQASSVGGATATASMQAAAATRAVVPLKTMQYVAAGQSVQWTPAVVALTNGAGTNALPVAWSGVAGAAATSTTNGSGVAANSVAMMLGPGEQATLTACAWTTVCSAVLAKGVGAGEWTLQGVSGTTQSIASSGTLSDATIRVVNAAGEAVAGVPVTVSQRVEGWQAACASGGRCAAAPVYQTASQTIVSSADGLVSFAAAQYASTATITRVMVSAGVNGYLAFSLEKRTLSQL